MKGFCHTCRNELVSGFCTPFTFKTKKGYCYGCARAKRRYQRSMPNYSKDLQYKYGISKQEFDRKLISQDGRCEICNKPMKIPCQDHDHKTGKNRDLLCPFCNSFLGKFREDLDFLASAARYLQKHADSSSIQTESVVTSGAA